MNVVCTHKDTGPVEYLTDHHNRDGELLVSISLDVNGTMTNGDVAIALSDEVDSLTDLHMMHGGDIQASIMKFFESMDGNAPFDPGLPAGVFPQPHEDGIWDVWFLFTRT